MTNQLTYARLKTIDGDEIKKYTKEAFETLLPKLKTRKSHKSDRTLYFITDNANLDGIHFFKEDYFEV